MRDDSRRSRIVRALVVVAVLAGGVAAIFWGWPSTPRWPATGWVGLALVPVFFVGVYLSLWIPEKVRARRSKGDEDSGAPFGD